MQDWRLGRIGRIGRMNGPIDGPSSRSMAAVSSDRPALLGYLEGALLTAVPAAARGRIAGLPVLALLAKGDEADG